MKGEINRDWYCVVMGDCDDCLEIEDCLRCSDAHRKWPTPEQFKKEYGAEWNSAVYVMKYTKDLRPYWGFYGKRGSGAYSDYEFVVCACTPWGRPPDGWRPE